MKKTDWRTVVGVAFVLAGYIFLIALLHCKTI